jgi:hypothetical protein
MNSLTHYKSLILRHFYGYNSVLLISITLHFTLYEMNMVLRKQIILLITCMAIQYSPCHFLNQLKFQTIRKLYNFIIVIYNVCLVNKLNLNRFDKVFSCFKCNTTLEGKVSKTKMICRLFQRKF